MTKYKLLKRLYLWVRKALKDEHLKINRNDIKCDNCNEWLSLSGVMYKHHYKATDFGYEVTCGQCGHKSYWNCVYFPMRVRCDSEGNPVQDK